MLENEWRETSLLQSFVCFPDCQPFESVHSQQSSTFQNENIQYCLMEEALTKDVQECENKSRFLKYGLK